ncbi:MAG TPA: hypothetical protein VJ991_06260, partial [Balneolales bacterium]|nr:hypothetical protein [Balneolales bacterium]
KGKRQKAKGKRQKAKGKRQKAKGKRQKANLSFPVSVWGHTGGHSVSTHFFSKYFIVNNCPGLQARVIGFESIIVRALAL